MAAALALATTAAAQEAPPPRYSITRATGPIEVDAVLDEGAWSTALLQTLDYEYLPGDNIAPPVETEVLMTYDDSFLFVGVRAFDPEPEKIRAHLMDRDEIDTFVQDDHIVVMLDTFNDERRGFQFRVNPLGVQADAIFSETDSLEDFSFDLLWTSAGQVTNDGYTIEMAIPLDQLRFKASQESMTWGVDLWRSYPRSERHRIANTPRPRTFNCALCQAAKVTGFESLEPGRNLVLTPTLTAGRTDERSEFPSGDLESGEEDADPGFTVRWGLTPNLTLSGTLNPDFSQVEADVAQLDINQRFALFFPEKRPFFLEGVDFFTTLVDTVFTRTVVDPDWGVKLTGKQGRNAVGVFAAGDTVNSFLIPGVDRSEVASLDEDVTATVLRYRRDVGKNSTLGVLYTGRESDEYHNRVGGLDGFLRLSDSDTINFQYLRSDTQYPAEVATEFDQESDSFDDDGLEVLYSHFDRNWQWFARWRDFGPDFRADFGFVSRVDVKRGAAVIRRVFWPGEEKDPWWNRIALSTRLVRADDHRGQRTDETIEVNANVQGPLQSEIDIEFERSSEFFDGVLHEDLDAFDLFFTLQPNGALKTSFFISQGDSVDFVNNQRADGLFWEASIETKAGKHTNVQFEHTLRKLDDDDGELFTANLSQLRFVYNFSTRMFARAIFQYRDIEQNPASFDVEVDPEFERLFTQLLFSYKLNAQTVLFLGYSDNREGLEDVSLTQRDRSVFFKVGYAWVL